MAKKVINYEEDIFFLNLMLKALKDGLKLDIDTNFFFQKVKEDIHFLSRMINLIYKSLSDNTFMLKRLEYLKNLQRLMQQFSEMLNNIINRKFYFSAALESMFPEYKALAMSNEEDIRTIRNILNDLNPEKNEEGNIVSEEEFRFLMLNEEENA